MIEFANEYDEKRFYRWIIESTEKYFEQPGVKERFEAWRKERAEKSSEGGSL